MWLEVQPKSTFMLTIENLGVTVKPNQCKDNLAVAAVGSNTNAVVAALARAALDGCSVAVLAIALAALFKLENVIDVAAEDLGSSVVFRGSDGSSLRRRNGHGKSACGDGKNAEEKSELPIRRIR